MFYKSNVTKIICSTSLMQVIPVTGWDGQHE